MPTFKRLRLRDNETGAVQYRYIETESSIPPGTVGEFPDDIYPFYDGDDEMISCTLVTGKPVWNWDNSNIPTPVPGVVYTLKVPLSALTPASGQTITYTGYLSKPDDWLSFYYDPGQTELILTGTPPASGTLDLILVGLQSDNQTAEKAFTKAIAGVSVTMRYKVLAGEGLRLWVGPAGPNAPTTQILYSPPSYDDHVLYTMFNATVSPGVDGFPFQFDHVGVTTGRYQGVIHWLAQTLYYDISLVSAASDEGSVSLSTTPPTAPTGGSPALDGTPEDLAVAVQIDYKWTNAADSIAEGNVAPYFLFLVNYPTSENIQLAISKNGVLRAYGTIEHGSYSGFNNRQIAFEGGSGDNYVLHFRVEGSSLDFATLPLPTLTSSSVSQTTIYTAYA